MGDNGIFLKIVKATLITIVILGHHGRGTMDMLQGTMGPWCPNIDINVHGAPSSEYTSFFKLHYP